MVWYCQLTAGQPDFNPGTTPRHSSQSVLCRTGRLKHATTSLWLILGGAMEERLTESQIGESPERTFQGLVVGLALGLVLWGIAILVWMAF